MTHVEVIRPGLTVRVGPDRVSGADVLEYAAALIEEEGWNHDVTDVGGEKKLKSESGRSSGWTLHDSIGEANRRLFGPEGHPERGDKDGIRLHSGETTRDEAQDAVLNVLGPDKTDYEFNDEAQDAGEVIAVLNQAREAMLASGATHREETE